MVKSIKKDNENIEDTKEVVVPEKIEAIVTLKVGDILASERLRKKIDFETVSSFLCIRKIYLKAIEGSNYDEMPEFPYGIGFVKSYADYLGLDGKALYEAYKKEVNYVGIKDFTQDDEIIGTSTTPNNKYILISILAVMLIYVAWFLINKYTSPTISDEESNVVESNIENTSSLENIKIEDLSDSQNVEDVYQEFDEMIETVETPVSTEVAIVDVSEIVSTPENMTPVIVKKGVEVVIKGVTWLEVKNENKLFISKELKSGDTYTLPDVKGLYISVGRIENADVYIDGVKTQIFSPYKKTNISLDEVLKNLNH